jgi:predicted metal-dependent hydrolase
MPEDMAFTPAEAVQLAQRLIDDGRPFHAHEVLEAAWKSSPPGERALWKGLAQIAVGLTHARRGNGKGAVTLLRRGAAAVAGYAADAAPGSRAAALDLEAILSATKALADLIAARGLDAVPLGDLRVRLSKGY